jgi:hypothetical protein
MPTTTTLTNPAAQLASIVSQLYDLAGNSQVPPAQKTSLLLQAHDLRGDLVTLVATQFSQNSAAYQSVMNNLNNVTGGLNQAQQDITLAIGIIAGAGQLAQSIDALLKEAAQVASVV